MTGFAVSSESSRSRSRSNSSSAIARTGLPSSSQARMRFSDSRQRIASLSMAFAALSARCARALHRVEVGERELGVDDRDVRGGIDAPRHVHDVRVLEAAHHVGDRVHLADVREELVAEALALRGAGDEAGDVDELDRRRQDLLRLRDGRERVEPRVGHGHDADVRVDGAERVVLGRDAGARQRVEQGRLADVRQADDAAADAHYCCAAGGAVCRRFIIFSAPSLSRRGNSATASSIASRIRRSSTALGRSST